MSLEHQFFRLLGRVLMWSTAVPFLYRAVCDAYEFRGWRSWLLAFAMGYFAAWLDRRLSRLDSNQHLPD